MADFEKDDMEEFEEEPIVVMTDEEGNEFYYREEVIIPVGDKRFAILVPINIDEDCSCGDASCGCEEDEETDVYIARIDVDESGEEIYVDPSDEEFEEVRQAYEELVDEEGE
jgi:acetone carboxylase gamma subunit